MGFLFGLRWFIFLFSPRWLNPCFSLRYAEKLREGTQVELLVDVMLLGLDAASWAPPLEQKLQISLDSEGSVGKGRSTTLRPKLIYRVQAGTEQLAKDISEAVWNFALNSVHSARSPLQRHCLVPHTVVSGHIADHVRRTNGASYSVFILDLRGDIMRHGEAENTPPLRYAYRAGRRGDGEFNASVPSTVELHGGKMDIGNFTKPTSGYRETLLRAYDKQCGSLGWWGIDEHFLWIDLSAGPLFTGQRVSGDGFFPVLSHAIARSSMSFSYPSATSREMVSTVAPLANLIHRSVHRATQPPPGGMMQFGSEYQLSQQIDQDVLLLFMRICDTGFRCEQAISSSNSWQHIIHHLSNIKGSSIRGPRGGRESTAFRVNEPQFCRLQDAAYLQSALVGARRSRRGFDGGQIVDDIWFDSRQLASSLRAGAGVEPCLEAIFADKTSRPPTLPVYVFDLSTRDAVLFDEGRRQVVALHDMVLVIQTSASGYPSGVACRDDFEMHDSDANPSGPTSPYSRAIMVEPRSAACQALHGILDAAVGSLPLHLDHLRDDHYLRLREQGRYRAPGAIRDRAGRDEYDTRYLWSLAPQVTDYAWLRGTCEATLSFHQNDAVIRAAIWLGFFHALIALETTVSYLGSVGVDISDALGATDVTLRAEHEWAMLFYSLDHAARYFSLHNHAQTRHFITSLKNHSDSLASLCNHALDRSVADFRCNVDGQ
jgi:hypothetical protein